MSCLNPPNCVRTHCETGYELFVNVRKSSNRLWKSSDVFGNRSEIGNRRSIFGNRRSIFGNSGTLKTKISRIWVGLVWFELAGIYNVSTFFSKIVTFINPLVQILCNISNIRGSVSSHFQTLRRELKIWRTVEYFLTKYKTLSRVLNKTKNYGVHREIKSAIFVSFGN